MSIINPPNQNRVEQSFICQNPTCGKQFARPVSATDTRPRKFCGDDCRTTAHNNRRLALAKAEVASVVSSVSKAETALTEMRAGLESLLTDMSTALTKHLQVIKPRVSEADFEILSNPETDYAIAEPIAATYANSHLDHVCGGAEDSCDYIIACASCAELVWVMSRIATLLMPTGWVSKTELDDYFSHRDLDDAALELCPQSKAAYGQFVLIAEATRILDNAI